MIGNVDPREPLVEPTIGLVRDFVNTVEWQVDVDKWRRPSDLAGWLTQRTGVLVPLASEFELDTARRLREGLRSALLAHAGHDALPSSIDALNDAASLLPLRMTFDTTGVSSLQPTETPAALAALASILTAVDRLRIDGTWVRLKACARDTCRWAYWDSSRNSSARWCSMTGCGNAIKMAKRDGREEQVVGGSGEGRPATLVDVAGRAGVSIKTVSNVVTGAFRVSPATRVTVEQAIADLDYRPNEAARALKRGYLSNGH